MDKRRCRLCRCTEDRACRGGCAWISAELDVCSSCAMDRTPELSDAERRAWFTLLTGCSAAAAPPDEQSITWGTP